VLAEAARSLGYANRFGQGIRRVQIELRENHNPPAEFRFDSTFFRATVRRRPGA
jgi:predicted HTH transcriptional regulator